VAILKGAVCCIERNSLRRECFSEFARGVGGAVRRVQAENAFLGLGWGKANLRELRVKSRGDEIALVEKRLSCVLLWLQPMHLRTWLFILTLAATQPVALAAQTPPVAPKRQPFTGCHRSARCTAEVEKRVRQSQGFQ
jgi:hypothetical protein